MPSRWRIRPSQGDLQALVHLASQRREQRQAQLSGRVAKRLQEDGPVVGHCAGDALLAGDVANQLPGRAGLEPALLLEPAGQGGIVEPAGDLAAKLADGHAQLGRSRRALTAPERHDRAVSFGRLDDDAMDVDGLDSPCVVAQCERLADPALEDELLIELAQAGAVVPQVDGILARVGNGAAADKRQPGRAGQRGQAVVNPVPGDPRAEVAHRSGREPARDQAEHLLEGLGRKVGIRIGAADQVEQLGNAPAIHRHAGDDLLGQDVEAVVRDAQGLDLSLHHRPRQGRRLQQVGRGLGDHPSLADAMHDVSGPAHALQAPGDVAGRLHLADQVDLAHVDAQFQRRRRHHPLELALPSALLGGPALVQAQAAVMGTERVGLGVRVVQNGIRSRELR